MKHHKQKKTNFTFRASSFFVSQPLGRSLVGSANRLTRATNSLLCWYFSKYAASLRIRFIMCFKGGCLLYKAVASWIKKNCYIKVTKSWTKLTWFIWRIVKKSGLFNSRQPGGKSDRSFPSSRLELMVLLMLWYRLSSWRLCCSAPTMFDVLLELPLGRVQDVVRVEWSM